MKKLCSPSTKLKIGYFRKNPNRGRKRGGGGGGGGGGEGGVEDMEFPGVSKKYHVVWII